MITLNLLSPEKKKASQLIQLYTMIKNLIIIILLFIIIGAITLLTSKAVLQNHFNDIVDQTTLITKSVTAFNTDIKTFNQQLRDVENIQKENVAWSNFLIDFSQLVPDGINVHNLTINKSEAEIFISGLAQTRNNLLILKDSLENSDLFFETAIPLENLLKKENITFNIKSGININELKQQQ